LLTDRCMTALTPASYDVLPPTGPPLPPPGSALVATYPVTGGHVGLKSPTGIIRHSGGLLLVNVANGKFLPLDNFIIDIASKVLTAHVVDGHLPDYPARELAPKAGGPATDISLSRSPSLITSATSPVGRGLTGDTVQSEMRY